ncbi:MAG: hypothetical protein IJO63_03055 [Bacilli bacterium]|nr:hypothetical protein [Bacilli bacterium]
MEEKNDQSLSSRFYWTATGKVLTQAELDEIGRVKANTGLYHGIGIITKGDVIVDGIVVTKTPEYIGRMTGTPKESIDQSQTESKNNMIPTSWSWDPFAYSASHNFFADVGDVTISRVADSGKSESDIDIILDEFRDKRKKPTASDRKFDRETYAPIQAIFDKQPQLQEEKKQERTTMTPEQIEQSTQRARQKSATPVKHKQERPRNQYTMRPNRVLVFALGVIAGVTMMWGAQKLTTEISTNWNTYEVGDAMAEMLVPPNAKYSPDIVTRHTHRTEDYQNFWFDNSGIAEDILKLPDEYCDAYMYSIYEEMGINRSNGYIDNWSNVINYLGIYADATKNPLTFARTNGCSNFEEYLIKNGWVDEAGEPSVEAFIEHGKHAVNAYHNILEQMANDRNEAALTTEEEPTMGGR